MLVGLKTDVCVYKSAAGLRVSVVEDATGSPGGKHARGLAPLRDAGAALTYCCKALGYKRVRTVEGAKVVPRPARFPL